jgi:hypothetical protein
VVWSVLAAVVIAACATPAQADDGNMLDAGLLASVSADPTGRFLACLTAEGVDAFLVSDASLPNSRDRFVAINEILRLEYAEDFGYVPQARGHSEYIAWVGGVYRGAR